VTKLVYCEFCDQLAPSPQIVTPVRAAINAAKPTQPHDVQFVVGQVLLRETRRRLDWQFDGRVYDNFILQGVPSFLWSSTGPNRINPIQFPRIHARDD